METSIYSLLEGAERATGTVAVIGVFRAFTTAAVALANGASSIMMVRTVEEALALRDAGIGEFCMGEVGGRAPPGFDFGNSPFEISVVDFSGKTIIQRTSAGTQGIVAASGAKRLYAASFVTAEATVRALLSGPPDQISLVAMADNGIKRTEEDVDIALDIDRYDFAVRVHFENGRPVACIETPPITMSKSPI
jgi:2-phosphosulfolactate phosphatase